MPMAKNSLMAIKHSKKYVYEKNILRRVIVIPGERGFPNLVSMKKKFKAPNACNSHDLTTRPNFV